MNAPADPAGAQYLPLTPSGPRRRFLVVVPAAAVFAERDRRIAAIGLPAEAAAESATQRRIRDSVLAESIDQAARNAIVLLLREQRLAVAGSPRVETLATPPADDLILRADIPTLPIVEPPDPASVRIERWLARLDPAETDRALADLAARRATWQERPPGAPAEAGDQVIGDVAATLLPARNHIPQPGIAGVAIGSPARLPDEWIFGDNGAGLTAEILAVEPAADPPHVRLRVHGTAPKDGQSYVIFHLPRGIRAAPNTSWVGSVAVRPVGTPVGLRGGKLRLHSQPPSGEGSLRRKDAALTRGTTEGFERCYVSETFPEAETTFLRMPLLFDHAGGAVDFCCDLGAPRLVEGLDLGEQAPTALPYFSGNAMPLGGGAPDPAGLAPHLVGLVAGETVDLALRLPESLPDRALATREARFVLRVRAVRRLVTPATDDAFARGLGFAGLQALRGALAARLAERHAALQLRQQRRAALDALLDAAGEIDLPQEAVDAEAAALWPQLVAQAQRRGATPQPEAAAALAARRLRTGLLVAAVAERYGLAPDDAARRTATTALGRNAPEELVHARALEDMVVAFLLAGAAVTERVVSGTELASAYG